MKRLPDNIPEEHAQKAEEIRAYLVNARGGAPFLSAADTQQLVSWLDGDVPSSLIMIAIDRVAAKRRAKRVRSRFTLLACRGELKKLLKGKTKSAEIIEPDEKAPAGGLAGLCDKISQMTVPLKLKPHKFDLQKKLNEISRKNELNMEDMASAGIKACRTFIDAAWEFAEQDHEQLRIDAEKELESIKDILPRRQWQEAVEEVMRDHVRSRYPILCAESIWDALNQESHETDI